MNFEVNGQSYFLNFHPEEGRWMLLTPTRSGVRRIEIVDDNQPMLGVVTIPVSPSDVEGLD